MYKFLSKSCAEKGSDLWFSISHVLIRKLIVNTVCWPAARPFLFQVLSFLTRTHECLCVRVGQSHIRTSHIFALWKCANVRSHIFLLFKKVRMCNRTFFCSLKMCNVRSNIFGSLKKCEKSVIAQLLFRNEQMCENVQKSANSHIFPTFLHIRPFCKSDWRSF